MRYEVNANTFMQLPYTTGTIQNVSNTDIEISNEQTIGTGIVLKAGETFAFNNATVYACARPVLNGGTGIISVVPFNGEGEGGESPIYVPKGSIAFASLPATLNSTMLGWTYNVSDAFTTDNRFVEGSGVDYPAGENVVVVEAATGVFKYDCFGGAYILPVANTTTLGGVKSSTVDGKVSVDNDGVMTINLPTASTTVKGGAKIGTGLSMSGEVLNLDVASTSALGGIKVGTGVEVANEKLNVKVATAAEVAGVLSSADEGKVTVNNDGTMTYNPLGYRQPSTAYAVGNIAYHSALPTGWYLECTTEGTTSSGDLTISSPSIGGTINDGTLTWKITRDLGLSGGTINGDLTVTGTIKGTASSAGLNISSNLIPLNSSLTLGNITNSFSNIYTASIRYSNNNSFTSIIGGTTGNDAANLQLFGSGYNNNPGSFSLNTQNVNGKKLIGKTDGTLTWNDNDLAGSAIVAKSLGENGYIQYASGLKIEFGASYTADNGTLALTFPVSFTSKPAVFAVHEGNSNVCFHVNNRTPASVKLIGSLNQKVIVSWLAIGY